jgi:hypothetical protein
MFREKIDLFYLYVNAGEYVKPLTFREGLLMLKRLGIHFIKESAKFLKARLVTTKKGRPVFKDKQIIYANTINNYEALKFLLKKYPEALLVGIGAHVAAMEKSVNIRKYLLTPSHFTKYIFILYMWLHPRYRARNFELMLKGFGYIDKFVALLHANEPACIFISNDHYPDSRALILAARKLGIKCIYIQHASVSSLFPPMKASHALLYGEYSEKIYRQIGNTEASIIPVGNHKFDAYRECIQNKKFTGRIGVAFNKLDPIKEVVAVCEHLAKHFPADSIILRPHPAEKRQLDAAFPISRADRENSLEFLKGIDVLVAGNSNILLEAASMNVHACQIQFGAGVKSFVDYYGFIRTGVAKEIKSKEELVAVISAIFEKGIFDARKNTKLYDASVGEPYEFDVENHMVSVINNILGK